MPDNALFSEQGTPIACSIIWPPTDPKPTPGEKKRYKGMCAFFRNTGGNLFEKAKILSMLHNLLEIWPKLSCGSTPINYLKLNDSYSEFTVDYVFGTTCNEYCNNQIQGQGQMNKNSNGYAPGWCTFHVLQYQGNTADGNLSDSVDPSLPYTTYMDLQILDANHDLINDTWYQESPASQTWGLSSNLPAQFLVSAGAIQSDPIQFSYNNAAFSSSTEDKAKFLWSSNTDTYANGFRSGNGGFTC